MVASTPSHSPDPHMVDRVVVRRCLRPSLRFADHSVSMCSSTRFRATVTSTRRAAPKRLAPSRTVLLALTFTSLLGVFRALLASANAPSRSAGAKASSERGACPL